MTGARVDGLRLQLVSVPLAAVWLVCRLTAIVRESDSAAVVTGARVDGFRLQWVSFQWAAVCLVCRLMAIVYESESELATGCDWCSYGRIAVAARKCSVGHCGWCVD